MLEQKFARQQPSSLEAERRRLASAQLLGLGLELAALLAVPYRRRLMVLAPFRRHIARDLDPQVPSAPCED
ncbi:hypothetical protein WH87_07725 [Devosia epidermidihirudinis]|uniref:Uncharacterized protein n=1 Tax=Devosia epidermidihirudinis TaxID=1293439 RepID=A0A0F5QFJ0_9HYPH|nr:hypothetical protein WH87_07725 [Devosia epidermidihirudinis]